MKRLAWIGRVLVGLCLLEAVSCDTPPSTDRAKLMGYVVPTDAVIISAMKLVGQKFGDSTLYCAFPVFKTGETGIATQDSPVCDAAYASLKLLGWQKNLYHEQQYIADTICTSFHLTGVGSFTPADLFNCGYPVTDSIKPPTATVDTLGRWDFASGASGWYPEAGTWNASGGTYQNTANAGSATTAGVNVGDAFSWAGAGTWADYTVSAKVTPMSWSGTFGIIRLFARWRDVRNWYYVNLTSDSHLQLRKYVNGVATDLAPPIAYPVALGRTYKLALVVAGTSIKAFVNDTLRMSATDATFSSGQVGVGGWNSLGRFDDVLVTRPRAGVLGAQLFAPERKWVPMDTTRRVRSGPRHVTRLM